MLGFKGIWGRVFEKNLSKLPARQGLLLFLAIIAVKNCRIEIQFELISANAIPEILNAWQTKE